jgi:hypothetical protein
MDLQNVPSQSDTRGIESVKKAIEAIRKDMAFKKAAPKPKIRLTTDHSCKCSEKNVKSKELTRKVIEKICCNLSDRKLFETREVCGKSHEPLCSGNIEAEAGDGASTGATVNIEGKNEANSTTLKGASIITATCECCGEEGIEVNHLVMIDSGQLLCPECLASFRKAASYKSG